MTLIVGLSFEQGKLACSFDSIPSSRQVEIVSRRATSADCHWQAKMRSSNNRFYLEGARCKTVTR